jgi:hypothetical protein
MRVSPSPDRPSSNHQSRTVHGDGNKRAVRCLDEDLASTKHTAALLQHSAALGSSLTSSCLDVETTQNTKRPNNKRGKLEADYVAQNGHGARLLCGCHVEGTGGQDFQEGLVQGNRQGVAPELAVFYEEIKREFRICAYFVDGCILSKEN